MEPIPKEVFDRELGQISIRELFRHDEEGNYMDFDTTEDRDTCQKKYRIPTHQRYNKWSADAKNTIIESIFKNYIIGQLSFSRHVDVDTGGFYFNIEDGQSRLTVIQEFLDCNFKFRGLLFNEMTDLEQNRFLDYLFATDITTPSRTRPTAEREATTIGDHYYENFDRINRGKALEDNDKYWCMKNKPMVALAIELIERSKTDYPFMKADKFNTKDPKGKVDRKPLDQFVTLIGALFNGIYKRSYSRHYEHIGVEITDEKRVKLNGFMEFYESIYDTMISEMPRRSNEQIHFNNPGKFLGMIIMHFKEDNDDMELDEKVNMWANILNIDRSSENFMKGTGSLWYNFTPANQKNQEQENIRARLDRIKEFYEDKDSISDEFNVEYVENEPE
tara:strand:- start:7953 stop:9122 length:1170 start_codon:yes stop_codon:yes gene_type:complete